MYIVTSLGATHCIFNHAAVMRLSFVVSNSLVFIRKRHAVNVLTRTLFGRSCRVECKQSKGYGRTVSKSRSISGSLSNAWSLENE